MAPVLSTPQLCQYSWLKDGTVDLWDVALMHDALAAQSENERRWRARQANG